MLILYVLGDLSPLVLPPTSRAMISTYPALGQSTSFIPRPLVTSTPLTSPPIPASTQSFVLGDTPTPDLSSPGSSTDTLADNFLPMIVAASVASILLIMIIVLMSIVILMLCKRSGRQQKTSLQGGSGKGMIGVVRASTCVSVCVICAWLSLQC